MDDIKIKEIISCLIGLKRIEWNAVKVAVEQEFDSASSKLKLQDAESLKRKIKMMIIQ